MIKLSIIIPVYNTEKYLHRCIESVLRQKKEWLELIIVDDGSNDVCADMCDEYGIEDDNIKVIHKTNGGLSSARNTGLEVASGEFIAFLDSDDLFDTCFIDDMEKYFGLVPLTTIPDSDQVIDLDEEQHRRRGRKRGRTK